MPTPASENDASYERDVALPLSFGTAVGSTHGFFSTAGFAAIILPQSLLASGCTALGASVLLHTS